MVVKVNVDRLEGQKNFDGGSIYFDEEMNAYRLVNLTQGPYCARGTLKI